MPQKISGFIFRIAGKSITYKRGFRRGSGFWEKYTMRKCIGPSRGRKSMCWSMGPRYSGYETVAVELVPGPDLWTPRVGCCTL